MRELFVRLSIGPRVRVAWGTGRDGRTLSDRPSAVHGAGGRFDSAVT